MSEKLKNHYSKMIKSKREAISLSLNKKNLNFLKEDLQRHNTFSDDNISISSIFDKLLENFILEIKGVKR